MMYDDTAWGWWIMGAGFLVVLILLAGAVAVLLAVRSGHGQAGGPTVRGPQPSAAALEALEMRFARGEVDEETYRRSHDLLSRPPAW